MDSFWEFKKQLTLIKILVEWNDKLAETIELGECDWLSQK